ncbi:Gfo/Idh/MocA family protein [Endozoicomonas ascidiicola]|uniref:Gfo/Idh/MocA family protein n=1 Tax=Endozoicomonas ascidiicola TaxID=1698521 RepID=UPI00082C6C7C|nr:Gfo/Idh/MocA family oxidoreductase [Endozoicomonas ascidiicola]
MLRTAVVGTGYLGKFHAEKYAHLPSSQLIGVADINEDCGQKVASQCNTRYFKNHQSLIGQVDAVSIVVPTSHHHAVTRDFLNAGIHVLVEKPIANSVSQAEEMIALAKKNQVILQVGFLERYNAALNSVTSKVSSPLFIESHRLSPFKPRSMDIDVIMDLMIHDLDIILNLVNSPLSDIAANGSSVLSNSVDIAQARLTFDSGCVANVTASRISQKSKRKMQIFQENSCICVDFQALKVSHFSKESQKYHSGIPEIQCSEQCYQGHDSLQSEIEDFLDCILESSSPKVSGEDGRDALQAAHRISNIIAR